MDEAVRLRIIEAHRAKSKAMRDVLRRDMQALRLEVLGLKRSWDSMGAEHALMGQKLVEIAVKLGQIQAKLDGDDTTTMVKTIGP